jgi:hypothetical protein
MPRQAEVRFPIDVEIDVKGVQLGETVDPPRTVEAVHRNVGLRFRPDFRHRRGLVRRHASTGGARRELCHHRDLSPAAARMEHAEVFLRRDGAAAGKCGW